MQKCSNVKKQRTAESQPIFTGSYKKKSVSADYGLCSVFDIKMYQS